MVNTSVNPLDGIRVLEFGGYISAPYASSFLASLGADVIKVERPGVGDAFRRGMANESPYFVQYNSGKRSLSVDLKSSQGIELIKELIPQTDVVLENLRPGKMAALGLGKEHLTQLREDLVYVSVTGFGEAGPWAKRPAYDMIGQSFGGIVSVLADEGNPQLTGTCLADMVTGLSTAAGILAALYGRQNHGRSVHMQTSLTEAISTLMIDPMTQYYEDGKKNPTRQSRHPQAQNFVLRTSSGESITLHLSSSQVFWQAACKAIVREDLLEDPRFVEYPDRVENYFQLAPIFEQEFAKRSADEWYERLIAADVPYAPVNTVEQLRNDEQLEWLQMFEPERNDLSLVRPPWRFDGERPHRDPNTPVVGQHTREIVAEVLPSESIDELFAAGVLFEG